MLTTVNFLYGNVFYIVRRGKLAWLLFVQPSAFFRNQDGGLGHLEFRPIFNFWSRWHRGSCNTSFMGFTGWGVHFMDTGSTWRLNQRLKVKVDPKSHNITSIHWLYVVRCIPIPPYMCICKFRYIYMYILKKSNVCELEFMRQAFRYASGVSITSKSSVYLFIIHI